jgi:hypothetical protein
MDEQRTTLTDEEIRSTGEEEFAPVTLDADGDDTDTTDGDSTDSDADADGTDADDA